jgi:ketosteroid isomerase-like protein
LTTITEHPDAALVRRGYEAFNAADVAALAEILDESASWHTPGRSPLAGDAVGRDAVFAQFGRYAEGTGGTFRAELRHVLAGDDGRVIALHRNSGTRAGRTLDVDCCIVFEIKDGRCVDGREFFSDLHAWDEFWS